VESVTDAGDTLRGYPVTGTGLGLRRSFLESLGESQPPEIDFLEVAPENWIDVGGRLGRLFGAVADRFPLICHGLSLNLGGASPLDVTHITKIHRFLDTHKVRYYSEHLSYSGDAGHLYDLLPIPFTNEAVLSVAARIRRTQEILDRRIAVENIAYYCAVSKDLSEIEFVNAVLSEADCDLLLDVNNVYVNSINHGYDADGFIAALPAERVVYLHVAGHRKDEELRIDTHAEPVAKAVWKLLEKTYRRFGVLPTVLERDSNVPPLPDLLAECKTLRNLQARRYRKGPADWRAGWI
jgi:hypothetical protein